MLLRVCRPWWPSYFFKVFSNFTPHLCFSITELMHFAVHSWMKWTCYLVICSKTVFGYSSQLQAEAPELAHTVPSLFTPLRQLAWVQGNSRMRQDCPHGEFSIGNKFVSDLICNHDVQQNYLVQCKFFVGLYRFLFIWQFGNENRHYSISLPVLQSWQMYW